MNLVIYNAIDHQIPLHQVDPDALRVVKILQEAGYIAYIVGGGVRDLLLKKNPKDYDISTSAKPEEIKRLFKSHCLLIGRRFRLAHIRFGKKILEVATFRSGGNEGTQLVLRDNEWGTPEQDVLRRDFTINGLFYDPENETVIDYVGGYSDLKRRYLRTIGYPYLRFKQDPVRMIRLIKFQARFGFEVDPETLIAMNECRPEIVKSSQARIFEELLRMLESGSSEPFIRHMNEMGFLEQLIPLLSDFLASDKSSQTFAYLREIDNRCHKERLERPLLLACLVYPFLEQKLELHFIDKLKLLQIKEIQDEVYEVISSFFRPFFLIPRRFRMKIASILTYQFRMTPLDEKPHRRLRIPSDPDFNLALQLLDIRTHFQSHLKSYFESWKHAMTKKRRPKKRSHG